MHNNNSNNNKNHHKENDIREWEVFSEEEDDIVFNNDIHSMIVKKPVNTPSQRENPRVNTQVTPVRRGLVNQLHRSLQMRPSVPAARSLLPSRGIDLSEQREPQVAANRDLTVNNIEQPLLPTVVKGGSLSKANITGGFGVKKKSTSLQKDINLSQISSTLDIVNSAKKALEQRSPSYDKEAANPLLTPSQSSGSYVSKRHLRKTEKDSKEEVEETKGEKGTIAMMRFFFPKKELN